MSDLEQLRVLTEQVRAPAFRSLEETARRRDRRSAMTALVGGALVVLLVLGGFLTSRSDNRSVEPVEPDPDRTQTVIEASYGDQSVHRFEAHEVRNTGDHAGAGGTEWHFARGVESRPGTEQVTLPSDEPGFVYVVQSDPRGRAQCQQAFEEAEARGDEYAFEGDMDNWGCTMKEARLRLLVDGRPVTEEFPGAGPFQGWFDFGAASLDAGHHEITLERVGGDPRVTFGLVLFEEAPGAGG
jgi:hypothetical protein